LTPPGVGRIFGIEIDSHYQLMTDRNGCVSLSELPVGSRARLCEHERSEPLSQRLLDLGLVPGTAVEVIRRAPLGDPLEVELRGYRLCLRRSESDGVCATANGHSG
jgi:ferrous iron transport protein A